MEPKITPIDATLGAVVRDIDVADMDEATWQLVEDAFHQYAALVFPGQHLSEDAQVGFASRFGEIERLRKNPDDKAVLVSNQRRDGSVIKPDEHAFNVLRGNEGWHMDSTYMPVAAKAGMLSAKLVPPSGGETELADMRAAYDALDAAMKKRISDLSAYHSLYFSQARIGHLAETGSGYGFHTKGAPLRPLVKTHPITGRKALCIGRHAYGIPGLDDAEAQTLLDDLLATACQPPRTYLHRWTPGDLIIWDNRCVLHRARPYDFSEPRVLLGTRIAGDPTSEFATAIVDARASGFETRASNR